MSQDISSAEPSPASRDAMSGAKVLVVGPDAAYRAELREWFTQHDLNVLELAAAENAQAHVLEHSPSVVVLALRSAPHEAVQAVEAIRSADTVTPVLVISPTPDEQLCVRLLEAGADDHVARPCSFRELLARVRVLLRRAPKPSEPACVIQLGDLLIDVTRRVARRGEEPLHLTKTEYRLLQILHRSAGVPVSHRQLLGEVWGISSEGNTHTLDTHLWRLRGKIGLRPDGQQWIRNVQGVGYVLDLATEPIKSAVPWPKGL